MKYNCKRCGTTKPENFYTSNKATGKCKKCHTMEVHHAKRMIKQQGVDYLGGKCINCGYNKSIWALEFHHKDPSGKLFSWGSKRTSWKKLKEELDKCILLCSNCHKEEHEKEWLSNIVDYHPYYDFMERGLDGKAADC